MEKVRLPSRKIQDCYLKKHFTKYVVKHAFEFDFRYELILSTMINDIENKIGSVRLHEYSVKNRSSWKLIISLQTYMKRIQ